MPTESLNWIIVTLAIILFIISAILWRANYSLSGQFTDLYEKYAGVKAQAGAAGQAHQLSVMAIDFSSKTEEARVQTAEVLGNELRHLHQACLALGRVISNVGGEPSSVNTVIESFGIHDERMRGWIWNGFYDNEPHSRPKPEAPKFPPAPAEGARRAEWVKAAEVRGIKTVGTKNMSIADLKEVVAAIDQAAGIEGSSADA